MVENDDSSDVLLALDPRAYFHIMFNKHYFYYVDKEESAIIMGNDATCRFFGSWYGANLNV